MPTYEYECKDCGYTFEAFQKMSDAPLKVCPECGKEVRRLINGGSGIIFKGSGFYVTDKKGASAKAKSGEAKNVTEGAASSAASDSASAPAEKPAAEKKEAAASPPPAAGTGAAAAKD
ncbi:MAG: zinc ribbon domain-containing protein [Treponema sp.]|jgi:putative FmdB family regulatory protein|nr:zinc ribbon domain-containing protein [Treponema sp.]